MTSEPITIPAAVAEYLYESDNGESHEGWTRVAEQEIGKRRWEEDHWLILTNGDGLFGIAYSLGLTENQDHTFPWRKDMWSNEEPGPIRLTRFFAEQVTTTVYREVKG